MNVTTCRIKQYNSTFKTVISVDGKPICIVAGVGKTVSNIIAYLNGYDVDIADRRIKKILDTCKAESEVEVMRFKKIEVTDQNGHKTEFLKDIDTGKLYKRTGLVPRDFPGCQIVEETVPSGCEWCKFRLRASNEDPCRTCSHNFLDNFEMESEVRNV